MTLLYNSQELTDERDALCEELKQFVQEKFDKGARPVPLEAALRIVSEMVYSAEDYFDIPVRIKAKI